MPKTSQQVSDTHTNTTYFSVTPQLQVPHGTTAFLYHPPPPHPYASGSLLFIFLTQNRYFGWAFSVRASAVKHNSLKENRKKKNKGSLKKEIL